MLITFQPNESVYRGLVVVVVFVKIHRASFTCHQTDVPAAKRLNVLSDHSVGVVNTGRFQTLIKIRANAVCCIHVSTVLSSQSVNHYQSLFCSHQMPIFSAKMHQIQFRLVLRRRHAELRLQCSISWWGRGWLPNPQERPALANHAYMASIHCHHHHHVRLFKYNDKQSVFTSKFITLTSEALRCLIDVSHNWAVINLRSYRLTPH